MEWYETTAVMQMALSTSRKKSLLFSGLDRPDTGWNAETARVSIA
jgi:hypothetical protein